MNPKLLAFPLKDDEYTLELVDDEGDKFYGIEVGKIRILKEPTDEPALFELEFEQVWLSVFFDVMNKIYKLEELFEDDEEVITEPPFYPTGDN